MKAVFVKTSMTEIPKNCCECTFDSCTLPCKTVKGVYQIAEAWKTKRHRRCPLVEIETKD